MRLISRRFPLLVLLSLAASRPRRLRAAPARARRRRRPACSGAASCAIFFVHHVTWTINSVCHFFGTPPLRDRRPVDQRRLARAAVARRVLAPQPPRLPALGRPRPALVGARPVRRCLIKRAGAGGPGPERRAHQPRAPGQRSSSTTLPVAPRPSISSSASAASSSGKRAPTIGRDEAARPRAASIAAPISRLTSGLPIT